MSGETSTTSPTPSYGPTYKMPQGQYLPGGFGPMGYMGGYGGLPMGAIGPPIPTPTSNFQFPGYGPFADWAGAHYLTTNPFINFMNETTNISEFNINRIAAMGNMGRGIPDPNLAFYNNMLAPSLTNASNIYQSTLASIKNAPKTEEKK